MKGGVKMFSYLVKEAGWQFSHKYFNTKEEVEKFIKETCEEFSQTWERKDFKVIQILD